VPTPVVGSHVSWRPFRTLLGPCGLSWRGAGRSVTPHNPSPPDQNTAVTVRQNHDKLAALPPNFFAATNAEHEPCTARRSPRWDHRVGCRQSRDTSQRLTVPIDKRPYITVSATAAYAEVPASWLRTASKGAETSTATTFAASQAARDAVGLQLEYRAGAGRRSPRYED